jgi:hypothetical protein
MYVDFKDDMLGNGKTTSLQKDGEMRFGQCMLNGLTMNDNIAKQGHF